MATEIAKVEEKAMTEFVPFGGQDKIKLSISIVKNLIAVKTKSGKTCSDTDAIKFIAMCQARRLNPFEGDAFLIGYDGRDGATFSLITAHQAFLKRAELNEEYDGMKSGIIVEQDERLSDLEGDFYVEGQRVMGGWATVYFKNRKQPMHKRIRLQRFQKAFGVWQDDPAGMICKCAEADALRSSFPTMLGGLYLKEELNTQPDPKISSPIFSTPATVEVESSPEPPSASEATEPPQDTPQPVKVAPAKPKEQAAPAQKVVEPKKFVKPPVQVVRERVAGHGLTVEQVMGFLVTLGVIDDGLKTIEDLALVNAEVFGMLETQLDDIAARIKS